VSDEDFSQGSVPAVSLAGHGTRGFMLLREVSLACDLFFERRGQPKLTFAGQIAGDVREVYARRTERLKQYQRERNARRRKGNAGGAA
jgi:hypothetical protein